MRQKIVRHKKWARTKSVPTGLMDLCTWKGQKRDLSYPCMLRRLVFFWHMRWRRTTTQCKTTHKKGHNDSLGVLRVPLQVETPGVVFETRDGGD